MNLNMLIDIIANNPKVQQNPTAKGMLDVVMSGDASKGEQMALNICDSMGVSKDEALRKAKEFFVS